MTSQDSVAAQLALLQSPLSVSLLQCFADGVSSVASPTGDVTAAQEQIDIAAAVASAVAPLNAQISSLQLSVSQEQALLASVQVLAGQLVALFPVPVAP